MLQERNVIIPEGDADSSSCGGAFVALELALELALGLWALPSTRNREPGTRNRGGP
jgi:hypothetical protein